MRLILTNERYLGHNVWNRRSFKLKKKHVRNDPNSWVRADNAFEPIIDSGIFAAAQQIIRSRFVRLSDEQLLDKLRAHVQQFGVVSQSIIDKSENLPCARTYRERFGTLARAYQLIGFEQNGNFHHLEVLRRLQALRAEISAAALGAMNVAPGQACWDPITGVFTINGEFTAALLVARCAQSPGRSPRWHVRLNSDPAPDIAIVVRMDHENRSPIDYFLLPHLDINIPNLSLAERNGISLDSYCFETLEPLFAMAARVHVREITHGLGSCGNNSDDPSRCDQNPEPKVTQQESFSPDYRQHSQYWPEAADYGCATGAT